MAWRPKMSKSLESAVAGLKARSLSPATGVEYRSTLSKWKEWNKEVPIESIGRSEVREFLDWVYDRATESKGGRGTSGGRLRNRYSDYASGLHDDAWMRRRVVSTELLGRVRQPMDLPFDAVSVVTSRDLYRAYSAKCCFIAGGDGVLG